MKTATVSIALIFLLLYGSLAQAQRKCCCRARRVVCVPRTYCAPTAYREPTCGLPSYDAATPFVYIPPATATSQAAPMTGTPVPTTASVATPTSSDTAADSNSVPVPVETIQSPSDGVSGDELSTEKVKAEWKSLFDGKTLGDWVITRFGGEGEVAVENGHIFCDFGQYITGVTYKGKGLPKNNYEIELEAQRLDGQDFFCGLTFPVDETHATFVVGGWGGSVTGISSIDQYDASENDTTDYMEFKNKQWYKIRVRVTKGVLEAWINDKKMVSKEVESSRLSTRLEVDPSKPMGVCCFDTQAAYRNIRIRTVTEPDSKGEKPAE